VNGGPSCAREHDGYSTIPKGEPDPDPDLLDAAMREFAEEA
jgi:predicted NUDIX family NTP pyrophosphohydrolase